MTRRIKRFIDPVTMPTLIAVGLFVLKSAAQGIIGWVAWNLFKKLIEWYKNRKAKHVGNDNQGVPQEEPHQEA